jgi:hypothetical protein
MALYLISYDLRKARNYQPVYDQLAKWGAVRVLESLWLTCVALAANQVRDVLGALVDADDGVIVIELKAGSTWSGLRAKPPGIEWLRQNILA